MNIVSNFIFHCNYCDANKVIVSTAAAPRIGLLAKCKNLRLRGLPYAPIIFARIDRPVNALHLCQWSSSHKETL